MTEKIGAKFNLRTTLVLTSLSAGVMSFFLPIYSKNINMSTVEITGLFSVMSFILIISRPIIGKLVDKIGRKPILVSAVLTYAISFGIFAIADSTLTMYIARIFQGLAAALMSISIYSIISDTTTPEKISEGFGNVNASKSTGIMYGCIISALILSKMRFDKGWKLLFIIFSIACLYALVKVVKDFKETKQTLIINNNKKKKFSNRAIKLLVIVFINSISAAMILPIFMIYLQDKFSNNIIMLACAFFPALLIESLFARKIGEFSDKVGKVKAMVMGVIICGAVTLLTPNSESLIILAMLWCISSVGNILYDLSEKGLYSELSHESYKGEMYGISTFISDAGSVIGPLIGGVIYQTISPKSPFYLNAFIMFSLAILIFILLKPNNKAINVNLEL